MVGLLERELESRLITRAHMLKGKILRDLEDKSAWFSDFDERCKETDFDVDGYLKSHGVGNTKKRIDSVEVCIWREPESLQDMKDAIDDCFNGDALTIPYTANHLPGSWTHDRLTVDELVRILEDDIKLTVEAFRNEQKRILKLFGTREKVLSDAASEDDRFSAAWSLVVDSGWSRQVIFGPEDFRISITKKLTVGQIALSLLGRLATDITNSAPKIFPYVDVPPPLEVKSDSIEGFSSWVKKSVGPYYDRIDEYNRIKAADGGKPPGPGSIISWGRNPSKGIDSLCAAIEEHKAGDFVAIPIGNSSNPRNDLNVFSLFNLNLIYEAVQQKLDGREKALTPQVSMPPAYVDVQPVPVAIMSRLGGGSHKPYRTSQMIENRARIESVDDSRIVDIGGRKLLKARFHSLTWAINRNSHRTEVRIPIPVQQELPMGNMDVVEALSILAKNTDYGGEAVRDLMALLYQGFMRRFNYTNMMIYYDEHQWVIGRSGERVAPRKRMFDMLNHVELLAQFEDEDGTIHSEDGGIIQQGMKYGHAGEISFHPVMTDGIKNSITGKRNKFYEGFKLELLRLPMNREANHAMLLAMSYMQLFKHKNRKPSVRSLAEKAGIIDSSGKEGRTLEKFKKTCAALVDVGTFSPGWKIEGGSPGTLDGFLMAGRGAELQRNMDVNATPFTAYIPERVGEFKKWMQQDPLYFDVPTMAKELDLNPRTLSRMLQLEDRFPLNKSVRKALRERLWVSA